MSKLRKSAKMEECTLRIFPYCNQKPETTVLAHINSIDKGMGIKSPDWWAVYSCSDCHDIIDGRVNNCDLDSSDIMQSILRGLYLTKKRMIEKDLITIA